MFRILPGLPPYGPMATPFPTSFGHTGREGFVVEFLPDTPDAWVGNFAPGWGGYNGAHAHPNGNGMIIVFSAGHGYVIDPRTRTMKGQMEGDVSGLWEVADPPGFVLDRQGLAFYRIGPEGLVWHTRRLSLDAFRNVVFESDRFTGEAWSPGEGWSPIEDKWLPFAVDLATGRSEGGSSYRGAPPEDWERLAGPEGIHGNARSLSAVGSVWRCIRDAVRRM